MGNIGSYDTATGVKTHFILFIRYRPKTLLPQSQPKHLVGFEVGGAFLRVFLHSFAVEYLRLS